MIVTRVSPVTQLTNSRDLDVTEEQLKTYEEGRGLIHRIFPTLSESDREFIMSGLTDDDWDFIFSGQED